METRTPGSAGGLRKRAIHFEWLRAAARPDSSTHSTIAFSGGARYNPTMSVTLATSSGSVENLNVSDRHGCTPTSRHAFATVLLLVFKCEASNRDDQ